MYYPGILYFVFIKDSIAFSTIKCTAANLSYCTGTCVMSIHFIGYYIIILPDNRTPDQQPIHAKVLVHVVSFLPILQQTQPCSWVGYVNEGPTE